MEPTTRADRQERRATALLAAGFVAFWAVILGGIHHLASSGPPGSEHGSVAFGAAFASAAAVSIVGTWRRRPWLTGCAGLALIPMSLLTFSPVAFPFLPAAAVLIANGFSAARPKPLVAVLLGAVPGLLALAAVPTLLFHEDPASWQTETGSAGSSDVITRTESTLSLGLAGGAMVVALAGSLWPRKQTPGRCEFEVSQPRG